MVSVDLLIGGIVSLVLGIILYVLSTQDFMPPGGKTASRFGGIVLSILGVVLIVLAVILPLIGVY